MQETGERWYEAELVRWKAQILISAPKADGCVAESLLEQSMAIASTQSARLWESRTRIDLATLLAEQSRAPAARAVLGPTREWSDTVDLPERSRAAKLFEKLGR